MTSGSAGYGEDAEALVRQYEALSFEEVHAEVLHLIPRSRGRVLDIGAGSGRDAAALSRLGHTVFAVEPTPELREQAQRLHPGPSISWLDDALPDLLTLQGQEASFDFILLSAVWMHLDVTERPRAMRRVASLLAPWGRAVITLRHGPIPPNRRMFDVPLNETITLAEAAGLCVVHCSTGDDRLRRRDVQWDCLGLAVGPEV
ncbi:class I SAM-dependent methyltransferase [Actinoallomurus sp. NPDC052308]|uniref:class I SAM-dependent methyltransferase n=1 Tax=Actinoallomurus sp. NPDC052308 TaxID=3155530 RepID=UPI003424A000